ncbi:hypothetical protein EP51_04000 [Rhodococcus opacus]|uniref:Uncharacterized protein n=1 Tax=Rhodococcus opacus TaxID=37919 RepID=A0A076EF80_RHOOP|nr:hypothetical protein EP51_04000 [Rhodococcus opacus]
MAGRLTALMRWSWDGGADGVQHSLTTDMWSCLVKWQVEAAPGTSVSGAASVSVDDRCQQWGRHVDIRDTWSD